MSISVIVPVYNGETVIKKCLDSILLQTWKQIELIIVNDGSTDGTAAIIDEYQCQYSNIIVIHKKNEGLPQARKTGVSVATGKYIGFVDADDWIEPDMYEKLYTACEKQGADVSCAGIYVDDENGNKEILGFDKELTFSGKEALIELHKRKKIFTYAWNKLYRAELFKDICYPYGNFVGEDYAIVTQVLCRAKKVIQLSVPLNHYVQTSESMSRGGYTSNYILAFENYKKVYSSLKCSVPDLMPYIESYLLTEYLSFVIAMGKNDTYNFDMIKEIRSLVRKHLKSYLLASYVDIKYKLSAVVFLINYKLLIVMYRMLSSKG